MKKGTNLWIIGHKLKMFRQKKELSLQEAAEKAGISAPFLSMVENGRSGISLGNLQKLLDVYGHRLADLSEEPFKEGKVLKLDQCEHMGYDDEGLSSYILVKNPKESPIFPAHFRLAPNAAIGPISHAGDEICFVIEGTFEVLIENPETNEVERFVVEKWDTIQYAGRNTHTWTNISNQTGILYSFIYYTEKDGMKHHLTLPSGDQPK